MRGMAKKERELFDYLGKENRSMFTSQSMERGEEYFDRNFVTLTYLEESDVKSEVHANVANPKGSSYAVRIDFCNHKIKKAACSCPYYGAGYCKHIYATLLEVDKNSALPRAEGAYKKNFTEKVFRLYQDERRNSSVANYIADAFELLKGEMSLSFFSDEDIGKAITSIYSLNRNNYHANNAPYGEEAYAKIKSLCLPLTSAKVILGAIRRLLYGDAFLAFMFLAVKDDFYIATMKKEFLEKLENRDFFAYRELLFKEEFRLPFLSSFSDEELIDLITSCFSNYFPASYLLEEVKRRKARYILPFFVDNELVSYTSSFLDSLLEEIDPYDVLLRKKIRDKMLSTRGLSLDSFMSFIRDMDESERNERKTELKKIASLRGFETSLSFFYLPSLKVLKEFSLSDFAACSKEVIESGFEYESLLRKKIETFLNKKYQDEDSANEIFKILENYPLAASRPYFDDKRLFTLLNERDEKRYLSLLILKNLNEEYGYHSFKE